MPPSFDKLRMNGKGAFSVRGEPVNPVRGELVNPVRGEPVEPRWTNSLRSNGQPILGAIKLTGLALGPLDNLYADMVRRLNESDH